MLLALDINSFALIDKLYLEFENGLNIITGETGAGKSVVVDSINFILGTRFTKDIIKKGADKTEVKAVFSLSKKQAEAISALGFECDENTVSVFRSINSDSKTICRFNDKIVTLTNLKQLASVIMEVHGQHENQLLFNSANHIGFLAGYAFREDNALKADFDSKFKAFKDFRLKILDDKMDAKTINARLEQVNAELKEFDSIRWQEDEEQDLKEQTEAMERAEEILNAVGGAYNLLYGETGCAYEQLKQASDMLSK
ncbi:MAG: AAA family ATPase, partial [Clostridia bacterium]|nr:AAA family ATPase [Clostridia bacterium]